MLDGMRRAAQNWLGKLVLTVMFSILIVSFAIWGIGDIFRGFGAGKIAHVGDRDISAEEYRADYQTALQNLQRSLRQPITNEQARAFGLDRQVLGRIIADSALDQRARALGLAMSDERLADTVFNDPAFIGPTGKFDRNVFLELLRNAGLDENRFKQQQRALYLRQELTGSLGGDVTPPRAMLEAYHRYLTETRSIQALTLTPAMAGDIPAPSAEELDKFFQARLAAWRAPEYRKIVTLAVTPTTLADPSKISEADAQAAYDRVKADRFTTPERRQVQQIVFPDEASANDALQRIRDGKATFAAIAAERKLSEKDIDLGTLAEKQFIDPAIGKAAFETKEGAISDVVKGRFGLAILHVVKVEPLAVKPFADVRADIAKELAQQRAADEVEKLHRKIEDERTSGKPLEEAAKAAGLTVRVIEAIDASGKGRDGQEIADLIERDALLGAAFKSDLGVDNETLTTRDRGYVWFEVAHIDPARDRKLDEVREQVEKAWREDRVATVLREKADALVKDLDAGGDATEIARKAGATIDTVPDVKRGQHAKLPTAVVERVFSIPVGKASSAAGAGQDRVVFKVVDAVIPPFDPASDAIKSVEPRLRSAYGDDITAQYVARVQSELGTSINAAALRAATGGDAN